MYSAVSMQESRVAGNYSPGDVITVWQAGRGCPPAWCDAMTAASPQSQHGVELELREAELDHDKNQELRDFLEEDAAQEAARAMEVRRPAGGPPTRPTPCDTYIFMHMYIFQHYFTLSRMAVVSEPRYRSGFGSCVIFCTTAGVTHKTHRFGWFRSSKICHTHQQLCPLAYAIYMDKLSKTCRGIEPG